MKTFAITIVITLSFLLNSWAQSQVPVREIAKHMTETIITSDKIYGCRSLDRSQMIIIYVGASFPEQFLTVVLRDNARLAYQNKDLDALKGKKITITGKVEEYGGKPQITITDAKQIEIE